MFILGNALVVQCFVLQLPRAWVQALTGELRSLKLHGQEVSKMMSILCFFDCAMWHVGSYSRSGRNMCPLQWNHRALTTGLPREFPPF